MPDLSALMGQMQQLMAPYEGPVNWNLAKDVARRTVAEQPDPSPTSRQTATRSRTPLRLADHWLDSATDFPSGVDLDRGVEPRGVGRARPSRCGSGSSSRSPSTSWPRWATRCRRRPRRWPAR